jgi:hypothetical protein
VAATSSIKPGSDVGDLGRELATEPLHQFLQEVVAWKFKARFLDEKGINHLEELFLSERFVDFLIYVGRFHALSHLATILKARSRNNGQQLSAA